MQLFFIFDLCHTQLAAFNMELSTNVELFSTSLSEMNLCSIVLMIVLIGSNSNRLSIVRLFDIWVNLQTLNNLLLDGLDERK